MAVRCVEAFETQYLREIEEIEANGEE